MKKLGLACFTLLLATAGNAYAGAVIDNGIVRLGVNDLGALNFGGYGLYSIPSGSDSTYPGCTCEGWGAGIASTGQSGYQNTAVGTANLALVSFTSTASTAVSTVNVVAGGNAILRVTHDYHPLASTPDLYEVTVSITNLTGGDLAANDLRYRRTMDWDIPFPGSERVTIQGVPAGLPTGNVVGTSAAPPGSSANPFADIGGGLRDQNFVDASGDIGAGFDFQFEALAAGATRTFNTYYGRSTSKAAADLARAMVDGDPSDVEIGLYSYGTCSTSTPRLGACDFSAGTPDTFIFGFGGAGGILDPTTTTTTGSVPEPATLALLSLGTLGLGAARRRVWARK